MSRVNRLFVAGGLLVSAVCGLAGQAGAQCDPQLVRASDAFPSAYFGYAGSMHRVGGQGYWVVGAPWDDNGSGADAGAAYVFRQQADGTWVESFKLTPPGALPGGLFGSSIDGSGAGLIVAAQGAGRVSVYRLAGTSWTHHRDFAGSAADAFGQDVAIGGSVAAIGAPFAASDGDSGAGRITILERDANQSWNYAASLGQLSIGREPGDWMGFSVATNGTHILAGAPRGDSGSTDDCGWVMVAKKGPSGWQVVDTLYPQGLQAGQRFGTDVAMAGNYAVIGAPNATLGGQSGAGLAYLYHFTGSYWQHVWTLVPDTAVGGAGFGSSVAISGELIAVAAPGTKSVYVFRYVGAEGWRQVARVADPDGGNDQFGRRVQLEGSQLAVGDPTHDLIGKVDAGSAYLLEIGYHSADTCAGAAYVLQGSYEGCSTHAVLDGSTTCGGAAMGPDVFFRYPAATTGRVTMDTIGSSFDTVLSVHSECPADGSSTLACNDDGPGLGSASLLEFPVVAGEEYVVRLAGYGGARGAFVLNVSAVEACRADFNGDGAVNTLDFIAFLNAWNSGSTGADMNGDGSVNTIDVLVYLNLFTAGC